MAPYHNLIVRVNKFLTWHFGAKKLSTSHRPWSTSIRKGEGRSLEQKVFRMSLLNLATFLSLHQHVLLLQIPGSRRILVGSGVWPHPAAPGTPRPAPPQAVWTVDPIDTNPHDPGSLGEVCNCSRDFPSLMLLQRLNIMLPMDSRSLGWNHLGPV